MPALRLLCSLHIQEGRNPVIFIGKLEMARQAAKILKGVKPAGLPVEQIAQFALVVNKKPAAALGIKIPVPILVQAIKVIK
jgi:putative ABC transport system substrate-binding protein